MGNVCHNTGDIYVHVLDINILCKYSSLAFGSSHYTVFIITFGFNHSEVFNVTPWSRGYGDVTVTYIHRSEIPSRIYAKHQYRQELECGSTVLIYILTEKYKYMVITESDTILQEYYITRKIQKYIIWRDIHNKSWEVLTSSKRGLRSQSGEELGGRATVMSKLKLRSDHHGRIRCTL